MWGLDKLAVEKRKEREAEQQIKEEKERNNKRPRITALATEEEEEEEHPGLKLNIKREKEEPAEGRENGDHASTGIKIKKEQATTKHYRGVSNRRIGTPSHAGGVDKEALSRISDRGKEKKETHHHLRWDSKEERKKHDYDDAFKKPFQRRRREDEEDEEPRIKRGPRIPVAETPRFRDDGEGGTPRRADTGRRLTTPSRRLSTPSRRVSMDPQDYSGYEKEYDREFYKDDDGYQDDENTVFMGDEEKFKKMEEMIARKQVEQLKMKQNQKNEDNVRWEENRLLLSGVVTERVVDTDFEEEGKRVSLLVHDIKPPFLDGRVVFTTQQETISAVKDPTSDMAILSRKGSRVVREQRELKERIKGQNKSWEVAGRRIGDIMGVKKEEDKDSATSMGEEVDYKSDSQYAKHMSEKSEAASTFSLTKTLKEQREYLPIFQVRKDLMKVIRDNNIVVIVGETGSGKTTQMTQYLHEEGSATPRL